MVKTNFEKLKRDNFYFKIRVGFNKIISNKPTFCLTANEMLYKRFNVYLKKSRIHYNQLVNPKGYKE